MSKYFEYDWWEIIDVTRIINAWIIEKDGKQHIKAIIDTGETILVGSWGKKSEVKKRFEELKDKMFESEDTQVRMRNE